VPYLEDEGWRVVEALVTLLDQGSDTARHLHGEGLHVAPSLPLYTPEIWQRCTVMLHNGYILPTNFSHLYTPVKQQTKRIRVVIHNADI